MLCYVEQLLSDTRLPDFPEDQKTEFINNLRKIYRAFNGGIATNEATSRNFINPFMVEVINMLDGVEEFKRLSEELGQNILMLAVEHDLSGSFGTGKVDYALLFLTFAIIITVAKMMSLSQGVAQNIVQLHSASEVSKFF